MPITLPVAALIGAGISAAGAGAQAGFQASGNRAADFRQYGYNWLNTLQNLGIQHHQRWENRRDWQAQNEWDLSMWNRINEYNHPAEQMARIQEAGLNPHLMYGQGTVGNASGVPSNSISTAGDVRAPSTKLQGSRTAGFARFADMFYNFRTIQAQHSNIEAQTKVLEEERRGKAYENLATMYGLAHGKHKAEVDKAISDALASEYNAGLAKSRMEAYAEDRPQMRELMLNKVDQAVQKLEGLELDNEGKDFMNDVKALRSRLANREFENLDDLIFQVIDALGGVDFIVDKVKSGKKILDWPFPIPIPR